MHGVWLKWPKGLQILFFVDCVGISDTSEIAKAKRRWNVRVIGLTDGRANELAQRAEQIEACTVLGARLWAIITNLYLVFHPYIKDVHESTAL